MSETREMYIDGGWSAACRSVNDEPWIPLGGVESSGIGHHGGSGSVQAFTETRWITSERGGPPYPAPFLPKKT